MGTSLRYVYTKQRNALTVDDFVLNGNAIFEAIAESGMVQVGYDVITGQCDRMVATATANPNDKVVALEWSTFNNSKREASKAFKVFCHPHLNFYLKVDIIEMGDPDSTYTALGISLTYAQEINASGILINPVVIYPRDGDKIGWTPDSSANTYGYRVGKNLDLRVSMGLDHFVMSNTFDLQTYEYVSAYNTGVEFSANSINPRGGYSTLAFAVVKTSNPAYNMIFAPRKLNSNTSYPNEVSAANYTVGDMGLQRKWLVNTLSGAAFDLGSWANVSAMSDLGTVSDMYGVRVAQLQTTINGVQVSLPLGCVHGGAVSDMGIVTVNLDSNGDRQYFCSYGFGPTNWIPTKVMTDKIPFLLLPWGD